MIASQQADLEQERQGRFRVAQSKPVQPPAKHMGDSGVLALQRAAGNRAANRSIQPGTEDGMFGQMTALPRKHPGAGTKTTSTQISAPGAAMSVEEALKNLPKLPQDQALAVLKQYQKVIVKRIMSGEDRIRVLMSQRAESLSDYLIGGTIELFGGTSMPSDDWKEPWRHVNAAYDTISKGQVKESLSHLNFATEATVEHWEKLNQYLEQTEKGADRSVFALQALQAAGAVAATALTGGGATAIAVGAGYGATQNLAGQASAISIGIQQEIDWAGVAFETVFGVITGELGGKLGKLMVGKLMANQATASLGRRALQEVVTDLVSGRLSSVLQTAAQSLFDQLRGRERLTMGQFVERLAGQLTDPKGMFLDTIMGQAAKIAHARSHKSSLDASSAAREKATESVGMTPAARPETTLASAVQKPIASSQVEPVAAVHESAPTSSPKETVPSNFSEASHGSGLELDLSGNREEWNRHLEDYHSFEPAKTSVETNVPAENSVIVDEAALGLAPGSVTRTSPAVLPKPAERTSDVDWSRLGDSHEEIMAKLRQIEEHPEQQAYGDSQTEGPYRGELGMTIKDPHTGKPVHKPEAVFDISPENPTYAVRAGPGGAWVDHIFTSKAEAEAYAARLAAEGEARIRSKSALPYGWWADAKGKVGPGNPVDRVGVYELPPNAPNIRSVAAPQPEGSPAPGRPDVYPGGGPQTQLPKGVLHKASKPIAEFPIASGAGTSGSAESMPRAPASPEMQAGTKAGTDSGAAKVATATVDAASAANALQPPSDSLHTTKIENVHTSEIPPPKSGTARPKQGKGQPADDSPNIPVYGEVPEKSPEELPVLDIRRQEQRSQQASHRSLEPFELTRGPRPRSPLTLPKEGIDMPWVGRSKSSSELGYLRDSNYFWKEYVWRWGEQLSPENMNRVGQSLPIVDDTWIQFHPEHAAYKGERIEHHHVGQGGRAVPLPEKLHDAYTVFHPQRQVVAEGIEPPRGLKARPTRSRTESEISRHTEEGRIRGPGIEPDKPPTAPDIPPSSELAGVPREHLRRVSPTEAQELKQVDPATGKVFGKPGGGEPSPELAAQASSPFGKAASFSEGKTPPVVEVTPPGSTIQTPSAVGTNERVPRIMESAVGVTEEGVVVKGSAKLETAAEEAGKRAAVATGLSAEERAASKVLTRGERTLIKGLGQEERAIAKGLEAEGSAFRGSSKFKGMGLEGPSAPAPVKGALINIGAGIVGSLLNSWIHDMILESVENMPKPEINQVCIWIKGGMSGRASLDLLASDLPKVLEDFEMGRGRFMIDALAFWYQLVKMPVYEREAFVERFGDAVWKDQSQLLQAQSNVRQALELEPQIKESVQAAVEVRKLVDNPVVIHYAVTYSEISLTELEKTSSNLAWYQATYNRGVLQPLHLLANRLQQAIDANRQLHRQIQIARQPGQSQTD